MAKNSRGGKVGSAAGSSIKAPTFDSTALPALQGSEKQVKWAESIRENYINDTLSQMAQFEQDGDAYKAERLMRNLFEGGVLGYNSSPMSDMYRDLEKQGITGKEADKQVRAYRLTISDILNDGEAETAYESAISRGLSEKQAEAAEARVYNKYSTQYLQQSANKSASASAWIEKYKGTKYSK